jgi:DNA repair protein RadC
MAVGTLMPGCVLAALLGGLQSIEIADSLLAHFRVQLADLQQVPAHEIDNIPGIGQHNTA